MRDLYKVGVLQEELKKMSKDEYYAVRVKGDTGKSINLDRNAIYLLQAYYDGSITEEQILNIPYGGR